MLTRFFIRHFLTFIIPISIPVIIFSIMAMDVFQDTLRNDIDSSTNRTLNMSKSTIELLFSDMNSNKILIDYNPKLILTLLKILSDDGASYEDTAALKHIYPFLKSASYSRLYINSIYIKLGNSSHFLANGDKVRIADYFDTTWYDSFKNQHPDTELWTEKRRIYNQDVVSIYQRTKLNGVIVINVLPEYFNNILDSITTYDNQTIMVMNENKQLIFSNTEHLPEDVVKRYVNESSSEQKDVFEINHYHVLEMPSEHYAFTYVSFIPNSTVYKIPNLIMKLSFFSILISVVISFVLAYYFSRRNYNQISNIIQTFKLAKLGKPITEVVERKMMSTPCYSVIRLIRLWTRVIRRYSYQSEGTVRL